MTRARIAAAETEVLDPAEVAQTEQTLVALRATEKAGALALSQHDAAVRAVALQVGYQLPADCTDPDLIQRDISANMRRSVEACLEVGRGLAVLKQACQHGQFMARLEVLGIDDGVARRFIRAAIKFSNRPSTAVLGAVGSQAKLFEMLILKDEEIEELELTGQTGELSLDDVATMSVKELRAKLRDTRAEYKAQSEVLAEKNAALDAKRIAIISPDKVRNELIKEMSEHVNAALGSLEGQVRHAFEVLLNYDEAMGVDSRQILAGHVGQIQQTVLELRDRFNLPDVVGDGTPEWMRATADDADLVAAKA